MVEVSNSARKPVSPNTVELGAIAKTSGTPSSKCSKGSSSTTSIDTLVSKSEPTKYSGTPGNNVPTPSAPDKDSDLKAAQTRALNQVLENLIAPQMRPVVRQNSCAEMAGKYNIKPSLFGKISAFLKAVWFGSLRISYLSILMVSIRYVGASIAAGYGTVKRLFRNCF